MRLVKGGQSRSADDVKGYAETFCWCVLLTVLLVFASLACQHGYKYSSDAQLRDEAKPRVYEGVR